MYALEGLLRAAVVADYTAYVETSGVSWSEMQGVL